MRRKFIYYRQVSEIFKNKFEEDYTVSNYDSDNNIEQKLKIFKEKLTTVSKEVCGYTKVESNMNTNRNEELKSEIKETLS